MAVYLRSASTVNNRADTDVLTACRALFGVEEEVTSKFRDDRRVGLPLLFAGSGSRRYLNLVQHFGELAHRRIDTLQEERAGISSFV